MVLGSRPKIKNEGGGGEGFPGKKIMWGERTAAVGISPHLKGRRVQWQIKKSKKTEAEGKKESLREAQKRQIEKHLWARVLKNQPGRTVGKTVSRNFFGFREGGGGKRWTTRGKKVSFDKSSEENPIKESAGNTAEKLQRQKKGHGKKCNCWGDYS